MLGMHLRMILFLCACTIGMLLAILLHRYQDIQGIRIIYLTQPLPNDIDPSYLQWLESEGVKRQPIKDLEGFYYRKPRVHNVESDILKKKISVLCIIIVKSSKRARAINSTWAQHCNDHLFMSYSTGKVEGSLKTVKPLTDNVFEGLCSVIHQICRQNARKYEWTLIVEDKAFAVIENLRYFVSSYDNEDIHYFGHGMKDDSNGITYNLASAGILVSNGAMLYLHENTAGNCKSNLTKLSHDMALGELFRYVNVKPIDTRDHLGRCRFNSFSMEGLLVPGTIDLKLPYWHQSMYLSKEGLECCSLSAITFNNVQHKKMFFTYYLLYRLHMLKGGAGIGNVDKNNPAMQVTQKSRAKHVLQKPIHVDLNAEDDEGARIIKKGFVSMLKKKAPKSVTKVSVKKSG